MIRFLILFFVTSATFASDVLTIRDAYIRLAPLGAPLAGYGVLINHSDKNSVLVDANATWAGMTMMHESREENGMAKMRHLDSVTVPAHGELVLQPGGIHLMFMQTPKNLKIGDTLDVELLGEQEKRYPLTFTVQAK